MKIKQKTIKKSGKICGYGLHTKKKINLKIIPLEENKGIIFRRTDLKNIIEIPAIISNVCKTNLSTNLKKNNIYIKTIEHLMFAINILEIDNMIIEIDSEEIPAMDGSSYPFIYLIKSCKKKILKNKKKFLKIKNFFIVSENEKFILAIPHNKFDVKISNEKIPKIKNFFNFNIKDLSSCRTFGFYEQYENLIKNKLTLGSKINNTLIFKNKKLINSHILRDKNEIIKHKILDFIGDISLTGYKIIGMFICFNPSHKLNNKLLNEIIFNNFAYEKLR